MCYWALVLAWELLILSAKGAFEHVSNLRVSFRAELKPWDIFNKCPISVKPFYHVSAKCPFPLLPNTFFWSSSPCGFAATGIWGATLDQPGPVLVMWCLGIDAPVKCLVSTRSGSASKCPRCSCFASSCFKVAEEESKFSSACIQKHQHQLNENCGAEQPSRPGKNNASRLTFRSNQDLKSSFTLYRWNPLCCLPWCSRIRAFFF